MKLFRRVFVTAIVGIALASTQSHAQNLVANSTFATGDLSGWTTFLQQNFGQGSAMIHRNNAPLGMQAPTTPDANYAAIEIISESNGWRSGLYQVVSGLTPGQSYTFEARGQLISSDVDANPPSPVAGDDFLTLFWVDGTDAGFATSWPGAIQNINQIATYTDVWTPISGSFTPTSSTIIVGVVAYFFDTTPTSGFTICAVDDFKLKRTASDYWEIVYDGSVVPATGPTGSLRRASNGALDPVVQTGGGAENPVGTPSYLEFVDNSATDIWDEYRTNQTFRADQNCTVVARMRRKSSAIGTGDIPVYRVRNGVDRFEIQIPISGGDWQWLVNSQPTVGTGPVLTMGALDAWHTVRLTWANEGPDTRVNVYRDGGLVPVSSHLADRANTNVFFELGGSGSLTGSYDLDWLLMTSEGAYAPSSGPALPAGYTEGIVTAPASAPNWSLFR